MICLNASALNTNLILLNSISKCFSIGLGNDSGTLGKSVAFLNYRVVVNANYEGVDDHFYLGRGPTAVMMPNFRNVRRKEMDFMWGYIVFYCAGRAGFGHPEAPFGAEFKEANSKLIPWSVHCQE